MTKEHKQNCRCVLCYFDGLLESARINFLMKRIEQMQGELVLMFLELVKIKGRRK